MNITQQINLYIRLYRLSQQPKTQTTGIKKADLTDQSKTSAFTKRRSNTSKEGAEQHELF